MCLFICQLCSSSLHCSLLLQLEAPQRQKDVRELEQELARLKHEGEAYRDDLKKQLEDARQAAMQARHEAGQAHARAVHEASLVQQLQDDKKRLSDIVDSWKKQSREQQVCLG